jgi:hypothetical protein
MKIRELLNICKNKANNQDVMTLKKKKLKNFGISKEDFLNIDIKKTIKKMKKEKWV